MPPAGEEKRALRREMLRRRDALPTDYRRVAAEQIMDRLRQALGANPSGVVAAFAAIGNELNLGPRLWETGWELAFPVVRSWGELTFHHVTDPDQLTPRGGYRIPEPDPEQHPEITPSALAAVVVPALAYDLDGYRIGYGKGYYDRFLARTPPDVPRLGVACDEHVLRCLPRNELDEAVHQVLTPSWCVCPVRRQWRTQSADETIDVGRELGRELAARRAVVGLVGPLGAGKTHLTRGIAMGLGLPDEIDSPTYTLAARYGDRLSHLDLYRLDMDAMADADAFVLQEELDAARCVVIEWADRAWDHLPLDMEVVTLTPQDDGARVIEHVRYME